jgi:Flp pilus assembly pilin Flp
VRVTGWGAPPSDPVDQGAASVEYGLVVFAIAATIVVALFALGPQVYGMFDRTCSTVNGGASGPQAC